MFKLWFFWKKPIVFQKKTIFLKIVELSNFSVECDWISNIFQHVQKLRIRKQDWLFGKKLKFLKTAKSTKFAVECNWISRFSVNVQNLSFLLKKKHGFFDKFLEIFKTSGISQIALQCNWNSENSQNVDKIGVFWKKFFEFFSRLIFFLQKNRYRYRIWTNMRLKIWKFPKRSNLDFLKKDRWVFRKKGNF